MVINGRSASASSNGLILQSGVRTRTTGSRNIVIESFSDERLKTDIQGEVLELNFIDSLRPVSFYNNDNRVIRYHGLISQGIKKDLNVEHDFLAFTHDGGTKGTDYNSMVEPLIKAAQQLSGKIRRPEGEKKTRN